MPKVEIIRPTISDEKWKTLEKYLLDHYDRAKLARTEQVDDNYERWEQNYYGIPAEAKRSVPWQGANNFVVKVIRIFVDTFVARTLNIIFATKPLYVADGYPSEIKEALELYLNRKALNEWNHYDLASTMLSRGNKAGTTICKTPYYEKMMIDVMPGSNGERWVEAPEIAVFSGPKSTVIPFEDFLIYPITCNYLDEALIKFHRVRYVEEAAERLVNSNKWQMDTDDLTTALKMPSDVKRASTQEEAGVVDRHLQELEAIECYTEWELVEGSGRYYSIIGVVIPSLNKMVDMYFNPYPRNLDIFTDYRPAPKEDFFYGESICSLLESTQEEVSSIHNDRRNNSFIANAPVFKRRSGSNIPNPSTNWYPGKVFDLEDMNDFEMVMAGRNYNDTLQEEQVDIQYAERIMGMSQVMQGLSQGSMGKKGMYNTGGTMALISEGNQRQDSNIRDFRCVLSRVMKTAYTLQSFYGGEADKTIGIFPTKIQEQIKAAIKMSTGNHLATANFEVKPSNAGANSEISKANLLQMASVLGQYGNSAQAMVTQLANPQLNPSLRIIMNDVLAMQAWMAKRLLRAWDEYDAEEILPDVRAAIEKTIPGGGEGSKAGSAPPIAGSLLPGGTGDNASPLSREGLGALSTMLEKTGGPTQ